MRSFTTCSFQSSRATVTAANNSRVEKMWYGNSLLASLLLPLSWLYGIVTLVRRFLYRRKILRSHEMSVPVVIIGNITAGGTGKTPVTAWLAKQLRQRGYSPGIVSRGYRGSVGPEPVKVAPDSDPVQVGDEAIMLARISESPVIVHPDRVAAASEAVAMGADVILSDDGLQHYRLSRDVEIAVIDGERGLGNGFLLPAGPLRESARRLENVDAILLHGSADISLNHESVMKFTLQGSAFVKLDDASRHPVENFSGKTVHAVAGIGNPERFFRLLEAHGIVVVRHPFPDHADFSQQDLSFDDLNDVVMTEKDAVKCRHLDTERCWYLPVETIFEGNDGNALIELVERRISAAKARHS